MSTSRIFILIASYRDPECRATIDDAFAKADLPDRIHVGVCQQINKKEDGEFAVQQSQHKNLRVLNIPHDQSKGANWARSQAFSLWQGQEYVLQIDSHMRFEKSWDSALISMLAACPSLKPILTAWLPGYTPPNVLAPDAGKLERIRLLKFGADDDAQLINLNYVHVDAHTVKGKFEPAGSCVANFVFAPSKAFKEVAIDPHINFWGDEINQSARWWTHGWDFFQPDRRVAYHYWDTKDIKDRTDYRDRKSPRHVAPRKRNMHLFGLEVSTDTEAIVELENYPLGTERKLEEYWRFLGVNFANRTIEEFAAKGHWGLQNADIIPQDTRRIFVNIASYRDPECQATIEDLFAQASSPERIFVGVCLQIDISGEQELAINSPRPAQMRIKLVHYAESGGANWARAEAQKLWRNEEYVLQIDSHMRFEKGWDDTLIRMLSECPTDKAVLSTYSPRYVPPRNLTHYHGERLRTRVFSMGDPGSAQLLHLTRAHFPEDSEQGRTLYPCPFVIANFIFAQAQMFSELPFDPHIHFWGDEITLSARLWTHGYNIYQPNEEVLYHYWRRDELLSIQPYRSDKTQKNMLSAQRVKHVLGIEQATHPEALVKIEKFGLGHVRSIESFWQFAGVDMQERRVQEDSLKGIWHMPTNTAPKIVQHTTAVGNLPHQNNPCAPLPPITRAIPRIFVNIASYRDPECQHTVRDLFDKAANPDRIFVGICWQFDEVEDQHCFEVVTRPEQVRIHKVDWKKAEGVCWARLMTQKLWEGEEYTLMIDAHMRFVKGWDELLLQELARCPSPKPVLSCSPASYVPPNTLNTNVNPTVRRVRPFDKDGNIRCHGEQLNIAPPHPLNGAFLVANSVFSRSEVLKEVPYDPYLYFDQEEITYALRLFTHGWDIFSPTRQFMYHFYIENKQQHEERALHWRDLGKADSKRINFYYHRGLERFNHLTGHKQSTNPEMLKELDIYGFGTVRTLEEFERYSGVDFKNKKATDRALGCQFIPNLHKYRQTPFIIPELNKQVEVGTPMEDIAPAPMARTSLPSAPKSPALALNPRQPVYTAGTPLKMLEPGDFFPLFVLPSTERDALAMELYGGFHCMVFYVPMAEKRYFKPFFDTIAKARTSFTGLNVFTIIIMEAPVSELESLRREFNVTSHIISDENHMLAKALGITDPNGIPRTSGFALNPQLRVISARSNSNFETITDGTINDTHVAISAYNISQASPAVVSEIAPAVIVPDVLTDEICTYLLDIFEKSKKFEGTVGIDNGYSATAKIRTDFIASIPLSQEIDEKLSRSVFPEIKKVFGFDVTHRELYKIGRYEAEKGGFFKPHRDNMEAPLGYRRVAMTIQLNDDYKGGGLRFPEYGNTIYRPPKGAGIMFPCAVQHEALKVTAGARYILVCFFYSQEDEAFRRHYAQQQGKPLRVEEHTAMVRRYPDLEQSRDFYSRWNEENVSYHRATGLAKLLEKKS